MAARPVCFSVGHGGAIGMAARSALGARTRSLRRLGCILPALAATSCSGGALNPFDPVGPVAADDSKILIDDTIIMLAIVIPTILLAFWMAWKYRASNSKAEYLPYWSYSGRIEAVVW